MSLLKLPAIHAENSIQQAQFDMRPDALERWQPEIRAAADEPQSISIYDRIGTTWDGEGVTAKRISAALRSIGRNVDVQVNINSPGGDFFEGVAIYNLLREHQGRVTVRVIGLAASAASVIAMAGDDILMGVGADLMIHNAWGMAAGNRHDFLAVAEVLAPFDAAMAEVYSARSGIAAKDIAAMMDGETWIGAEQAVRDGFATGMIAADVVASGAKAEAGKKYLSMVEAAMTRAGHSRSVRRDALRALFSGTPGAAGTIATPSAGTEMAALLHSFTQSLKG
ncbi:head maturation protease, ClpP-related [Herbaspirillum autotrophicum]|uniref:head maturation protease, ClpP-related n=1 Tax=Herbaspirillum autotrophicum TaxID=180195 RepID=UPI00067BEEAF|nr:head maturation protease, ClpP-related [Herbaspirillum autotrophicum]